MWRAGSWEEGTVKHCMKVVNKFHLLLDSNSNNIAVSFKARSNMAPSNLSVPDNPSPISNSMHPAKTSHVMYMMNHVISKARSAK